MLAREPSQIHDLCHIKDKKLKYTALPETLPTDVQDYVFNRILEGRLPVFFRFCNSCQNNVIC